MKKTILFLAIAFVVCVASVFALTACNFEKLLENADFTESAEYTDKDNCVGALNSFFEETLKDPDFVVTCKNKDGEVQYTETVKGTACNTVYSDGSDRYAYKKGEFFYVVAIDREQSDDGEVDETRYYYCSDPSKGGYMRDDEITTMEDMYKSFYCAFMGDSEGFNRVSDLPEKDSTFLCVYNGEKKDGVTTGTMTFDYSTTSGTLKITATSKENLVQTIHLVVDDKSGLNADEDLTWTFAYGGAAVILPDTDTWDREYAEAEKQAKLEANLRMITKRDEFLGKAVTGENMFVTVSGDIFHFVETIADGIDRVVYDEYTTYAYAEEVGDGNYDYYVLRDVKANEEYDMEAQKYYAINADDDLLDSYEDNNHVYYNFIIAMYDGGETSKSATNTCDIEGDTMTFKVVCDEATFTLTATKIAGVVKTIDIAISDTEDPTTISITFEYDTAELTKPDLSEYELQSGDAD